MSSIATPLLPGYRYIIFFRVPDGINYDYVEARTIYHLQKYGRVTLYYFRTQRSYIRHHSNVFLAPSFINERPYHKDRIYFIYNIIQILSTIPLHKPLHIDLDDYPELFI